MNILQKVGRFLSRLLPTRNASPQDYNPKNVRIKKLGRADITGGGGSQDFEAPEWDFQQIVDAYATSSYTRQALDKYVELVFKEGYDFTGPNPETIEYIRQRFKIMAIATGLPTEQFFYEIAEDLVKFSNVFIVKARQKNNNGLQMQGKSLTGVTGKQPIAGYFLLNPTTVTVMRDEHGTVTKYQQEVPGNGDPIEFAPEDVIHIFYKRDRGKAFGQPFILPVLDDIRALREAEESVLRLLYRHLFPLYQYKVGIAEPGFEADETEIEQVRQQIEQMPADGGVVTPERHEIKVIGAEGEAIDAKAYLEHFEKRVFTGLGVSEIMMGRSDTANRSTADSMTAEMHDRIKAYQEVMSVFITEFIVQELLLEAGYDPLENPENIVKFQFREIDTELKIKKENHAIFKYEHNSITEDEMRQEIGMDPITDRAKMFLELVTRPTKEMGASSASQGDTNNRNEPQNQNNTGDDSNSNSSENQLTQRKKIDTKESLMAKELLTEVDYDSYIAKLNDYYELSHKDVIDLVEKYFADEERKYPNSTKDIENTLHSLVRSTMRTAEKNFTPSFYTGISEAMSDLNADKLPDISYAAASKQLSQEHDKYFKKLIKELSNRVDKILESNEKQDSINKINRLFESLRYRLDFIAFTELMKSYNYGYALTAKKLGLESLDVYNNDGCEVCRKKSSIDLTANDFFDQIPPFHTKCHCTLSNKTA